VALFTADAWRSFFIVAIGTAALWLYMEKKIRGEWMVAAILLLSLIDLWGVNKRYLNDDDFVTPTQTKQQFTLTPADQVILQDSTLYYRVLNMATSTFNDGITPYHHKVIGGYHAAKLRRYQDLIDRHLTPEMSALQQAIVGSGGTLDSVKGDSFKLLNMLNTRWVIMPAQGGGTLPVLNPHAMGNAWFVDEIRFTESADEEIEAVGMLDLHHAAVADKKFEPLLKGLQVTPADSASTIRLLEYDSDYLVYEADVKKDEMAVFSEIYYPKGWQITINGEPAEMLRVNYTLRGMVIPEGKQTIIFQFDPQSIRVTDSIAYGALLMMLLTAVYLLLNNLKRKKN
ncbi:MAG TPA: YfhO family protein, partial [Proteiniphilum sp.]|nr:YfhO family protein [Proteiniphilum sp.]